MLIFLLILLVLALFVVGMVVAIQIRDSHPRLSVLIQHFPFAVVVCLFSFSQGSRWLGKAHVKEYCSTIESEQLLSEIESTVKSDSSLKIHLYRWEQGKLASIASTTPGIFYECVILAKDNKVLKSKYVDSNDFTRAIVDIERIEILLADE